MVYFIDQSINQQIRMSLWQMWRWSWLHSPPIVPVCIFSQGPALSSSQKASGLQPLDGGGRACFSPGALALGNHWLSLFSPFLSRKLLGFLEYTPLSFHKYYWPQLIKRWEHVISSILFLFNGCSLIVFQVVHGSRMLFQTIDFQKTEAWEHLVQSTGL